MPDLSLRQITFHSDLVSKPVRDNFTDTENAINNLQDQIDLLTTTPGGTEVTNARDYHTVLRDRLRSDSLGRGNVLVSGGVVTQHAGTPNMTVDITAGEAVVGGIAVKWSAQTSGTITAPVSNTRLDYVVVNSDSSISVVAGTSAASPAFPSVASTQIVVAALVVKSTTTSLNNGVEVFVFKDGHHLNYQDFYIGSSTTLSQGNYPVGNIIFDAAITLSCVQTGTFKALNKEMISIQCYGNFHSTTNGTFAVATSNVITRYFSDGSAASTGKTDTSGGGGGASSVAAGGAGGNGTGTGGAGGTVTRNASIADPNYSSGKGGNGYNSGSPNASDTTKVAIIFSILAENIYLRAGITNNGAVPSNPTTGGGCGGDGGGAVLLIANNAFTASAITVNCAGSVGANAVTAGGGGGGGGGGLIFIRSNSFSSSATLTVSGGAGGTGAGGGASGSNGSAGLASQKLWTDNDSIYNTRMPFNIF